MLNIKVRLKTPVLFSNTTPGSKLKKGKYLPFLLTLG